MSAGNAAAMVWAVCKHPSIPAQVDQDEAMEQFAFSRLSFYTHTPEAFGADLLIPLRQYIEC